MEKLPKPTQEDLAHAIEGLPEGWGANISNSWNRIYYFKKDSVPGTNNHNQQWTRPTNSGGKKKGKSVKKKSSKKGKGTRKK